MIIKSASGVKLILEWRCPARGGEKDRAEGGRRRVRGGRPLEIQAHSLSVRNVVNPAGQFYKGNAETREQRLVTVVFYILLSPAFHRLSFSSINNKITTTDMSYLLKDKLNIWMLKTIF